MINREQLKLEIDTVDDAHIEILHRIIQALKQPLGTDPPLTNLSQVNPLKGSVIFEHDLISPINVSWDVEQ
ncbi:MULTISPECIES: hypothetical protein [Planktothrix]|uniref:hypothetical protein n=1 Tax=Planktothrix TaxID=54304 RepID=UPI000406DE61|nr:MULTISPECIES: hypothetical protein [Planktothrix]